MIDCVDRCFGVACPTPDQCHTASTCDPTTGACSNPAKADNSQCDDGNSSTANDQCVGGTCTGTDLCANVTCTAQDQCHTVGTCDPTTGACSNPAKADSSQCDDGKTNTVNDHCIAGTCTGTDLCANVTCTASDQCHNTGSCDPATGLCSNPTKPNNTACDDVNACTEGDSCQSGACQAGAPVAASDDNACTVDSCDPLTGTISHLQDDTACNDDDACSGTETCDVTSGCQPGVPLVCNDGNTCTDDGCNPQSGCTTTFNTATCNDGKANTINDQCINGVCTGTNLCATVTCAALDQCHNAGSCDPTTGTCSNPAKPDTTQCDDGSVCTSGDSCLSGICTGGMTPSCDDQDPCTVDSCNQGTGCQHVASNAGVGCQPPSVLVITSTSDSLLSKPDLATASLVTGDSTIPGSTFTLQGSMTAQENLSEARVGCLLPPELQNNVQATQGEPAALGQGQTVNYSTSFTLPAAVWRWEVICFTSGVTSEDYEYGESRRVILNPDAPVMRTTAYDNELRVPLDLTLMADQAATPGTTINLILEARPKANHSSFSLSLRLPQGINLLSGKTSLGPMPVTANTTVRLRATVQIPPGGSNEGITGIGSLGADGTGLVEMEVAPQ